MKNILLIDRNGRRETIPRPDDAEDIDKVTKALVDQFGPFKPAQECVDPQSLTSRTYLQTHEVIHGMTVYREVTE
jgi:hypothetical protein